MSDRGLGLPSDTQKPGRNIPIRASVVTDLLEEMTAQDNAVYGQCLTRSFHVSDIPGPPECILVNALKAAGIPTYGNIYPGISPTIVPVESRVARLEPGCTDKVRVTVTYAIPYQNTWYQNDPDDTTAVPQLEFISAVKGIAEELDVNGNPILGPTIIKNPDDTTDMILLPGQEDKPVEERLWFCLRVKSVEAQHPMPIVRYHRRERNNPMVKARDYVGCINSTAVFGDPPHTWLCTDISGMSEDGGQSYNVSYEFQRCPSSSTWDKVLSCEDPQGRYVDPSNYPAPFTNTIFKYQVYREINFWPLNLTTA